MGFAAGHFGTVVLTGVKPRRPSTGVLVSGRENRPATATTAGRGGCHGTGGVAASSFVGAYMHVKPSRRYLNRLVIPGLHQNTLDDPDHWYGVKFEPVLGN